MAIIKGEKLKKAFTGTREYAQEKENAIVFMSSGIKVRKAALDTMKIKTGDFVWHFVDDSNGKVYIAQVDGSDAESSKIGENQCFSNKGLTEKMFELAGKSSADFQKGDQLVCAVATKPVEGMYYEITFSRYSTKAEVEAEETVSIEEDEDDL